MNDQSLTFFGHASSHVPAHRGVWKPLSVSRVWNVHGTCLPAAPLLFFFHRHDDVTPSRFRALESYVLRVLDGNEIKLWSSPSLSVFTVFVDLFFIHTISVGLSSLSAPLSSIFVAYLSCNDRSMSRLLTEMRLVLTCFRAEPPGACVEQIFSVQVLCVRRPLVYRIGSCR